MFLVLIAVFAAAVFSIKDDSLTMDELAHLPAGYSYLTQKDMRLNPEHPPLIKDLAAIPLLFIKNITFPAEIKAWREDVNGQWDFGNYFLYQSKNPADEIIFRGRIPMILMLLLLGFYIFKWAKELFGNKAAVLSISLFSLSPALLAQGRLVTTDVGAAFGVFAASYYFLRALKLPNLRNVALAGAFLGIGLLLKFSAILLIPFFGILGIAWLLKKSGSFKQTTKTVSLIFLIGFILIWPVYQYHTLGYPPEKQADDAKTYLAGQPDFIKQPIVYAAKTPILRPYAQYLTGLFMVFQRVSGGNTTYFLGEVNNQAWKYYFPVIYLIKEPLAFHILTLIAFLYGLKRIRKMSFPVFASLLFIAIYWIASINGNLNIGVRHLLPVFPFTIFLVAGGIGKLLEGRYLKTRYLLLSGLIAWQAWSVASVYPHFLAYFNELAGGPDNGYKYAVDSNLDWGQDLKRLARWVEKNNIPEIKIAYFGGGDPKYYLGDKAKYFSWEKPQKGWIAVSATLLQGGRGKPAPGFNQPTGFFDWLNQYPLQEKIGYSIFIYRIE